MNEILGVICVVSILIIFTSIIVHITLKKDSSAVNSSRYILNKFEPDNTAPKLTEMIDFHKNNKKLSKYNIK